MHHYCIMQAVPTLLAALPTSPPSAPFLLWCAIPDTFQHVSSWYRLVRKIRCRWHSSVGADGNLNFVMFLSEVVQLGRLLWMGKWLQQDTGSQQETESNSSVLTAQKLNSELLRGGLHHSLKVRMWVHWVNIEQAAVGTWIQFSVWFQFMSLYLPWPSRSNSFFMPESAQLNAALLSAVP